jgi:hypothetical protein
MAELVEILAVTAALVAQLIALLVQEETLAHSLVVVVEVAEVL